MSRGLVGWIALCGVACVLAGCGRDAAALRDSGLVDAAEIDAAIDAAIDAPPDAAIDAPVSTGLPDLQFETARMEGSIIIQDDVTFAAVACEVVVGCISGPSPRRLLRFATVTMNLGTADLVVGVPPPPGESNTIFEWSQCHMHHHFRDYTSYELLDETGHTLVTGRKQSFCLGDNANVTEGEPSNGYTCNKQGISRGWADIYDHDVACNWLDITGIPHGTYTLKIVVNPLHKLAESDETNNVFTMGVPL
jgi:hypothetical protein